MKKVLVIGSNSFSGSDFIDLLLEKGNYEVKPVAFAGYEEGYLSTIKVTWDDSP